MWIRILLLVLLPLVLVVLYIEGQDYEPHMVTFSEESPLQRKLNSLLPDRIDSYFSRGTSRIYLKDNLYEYIDGHAEYFIGAGFSGLVVKEYQDKRDLHQFRVEAYRMGKAIEALGVLEDEAAFGSSPVRMDTPAYLSDEGLSFIKGPYYVKIVKLKGMPPLRRIASFISDTITEHDSSLNILKEFPMIGRVIRTEYHREGYRGIELLREVVARKYALDGRELTIFMKKTDSKGHEDTYKALINYFKSNDIPFDIKEINDNTLFIVNDPFGERWSLYLGEGRLVGLSGFRDLKEIKEILQSINKGARKG